MINFFLFLFNCLRETLRRSGSRILSWSTSLALDFMLTLPTLGLVRFVWVYTSFSLKTTYVFSKIRNRPKLYCDYLFLLLRLRRWFGILRFNLFMKILKNLVCTCLSIRLLFRYQVCLRLWLYLVILFWELFLRTSLHLFFFVSLLSIVKVTFLLSIVAFDWWRNRAASVAVWNLL